jgi:IclR family KDG regulon transcriptional repressor
MEPVPFEMLGTLIRAGDVLDLFTVEEPEWGVTATAQRLGIGKSLAHEALATLTEIGLLQRIGHGRYRLGWRTMSLASVLLRTSAIGTCARPVIRELVEFRGIGVSLVAWDRGRIVYINRHQRRVAQAAPGPVAGTTFPADDSAPAKVLLASRSAAEVTALWGRGDLRTRHDTLLGLTAELAEVRRVGWAQDGHPATRVAAPVRDPDGDVAAAICLVPPVAAGERDLQHHASLAVAAAARISEAMRSGSAARPA